MCRKTGRNGITIFETTIARGFANRRGPIPPDERRADGRRELRRPRILKQGRGQGDHIFLTDRGKQAKNLFALTGKWHIK